MVVEWHLPVGCDWSGFFVEMLGYLPGLVRSSKRSSTQFCNVA